MRNVSSLGFILLLPLAGCDAAQDLLEQIASEADARQAMSAMVSALSENQPSQHGLADAVHRAAGDGDKIVDVSLPCQDGGLLRFEGTLSLENLGSGLPDDFDPTSGEIPTGAQVPSVGFTYAVKFEGCTVDGVTLDGSVEYALETGWDDAASRLDATWDYAGQVEVTGDVVGSCAFDFGGTGDLGLENWAGGVPADFEGDACGFEAAELGL